MDRKTMLERLKAGYSPIDVSLEKWYDLLKEWDMGSSSGLNCALCEMYSPECSKCPLFKTGNQCCPDEIDDERNIDTPYRLALQNNDAQIMIDALLKAKIYLEEQKCLDKSEDKPKSFKFKLEVRDGGSIEVDNVNQRKAFITPDNDGMDFNDFFATLLDGDIIYIVTKDKLKVVPDNKLKEDDEE